MTASKQPDFEELNALAIEACDMWQEHLSSLASDPGARADLTRFLEPQRRLFADWASMMQKGATPANATTSHQGTARHDSSQQAQAANPFATITPEPTAPEPAKTSSSKTSGSHEHGDDSLRTAQLALRVAELEKRLAQLESRLAKSAGATRGTQRATS